MATKYQEMTVAQLRDEFERRGNEAEAHLSDYVSKSPKVDLIAGLAAHDASHGPQGKEGRQPRYDDGTLARVVELRDDDALSWAKIPNGLDLGSPH